MKKFIVLAFLLTGYEMTAQQVQNFTLINVMNNQTISLDTYPSCEGLVIIFTSNACPYDEQYRARISKLTRDHQDKVPVLLVNSYIEPAESAENMKKKGDLLKLSVPYLADKEQVLLQQLKATKSPQAFLLKNNGGKFMVVYSGAIDDNAQVEKDVRHAYLSDAIDIMLANQTIATPEIRPVGCTIRKK